jgi:hypothetical protein
MNKIYKILKWKRGNNQPARICILCLLVFLSPFSGFAVGQGGRQCGNLPAWRESFVCNIRLGCCIGWAMRNRNMAYRILSLDGGGTWALIQVKALMKIYGNGASGYDILRDFDLVVANSGGSIVAAALACNFKLQDLLKDFTDPNWLNTIFVRLPLYDRLNPLRFAIPMPEYDAAAKLEGLRKALGAPGDIPLEQIPRQWDGKPQLLITSFDFDRERAVFFRTNLQSPPGPPPIPFPQHWPRQCMPRATRQLSISTSPPRFPTTNFGTVPWPD